MPIYVSYEFDLFVRILEHARALRVGVKNSPTDAALLRTSSDSSAVSRPSLPTMRKLKFHEQKLLKKVNFYEYKREKNLREVKVLRKYHIQKREDYIKYGICVLRWLISVQI